MISFHETWVGEGTTHFRFYNFMEHLIIHLAFYHPDKSFCFTIDNLNIHKNQLIENMILCPEYRVVWHATYRSLDDCSIEYVANTIHTKLQQYYKKNIPSLIWKTRRWTLSFEVFIPSTIIFKILASQIIQWWQAVVFLWLLYNTIIK